MTAAPTMHLPGAAVLELEPAPPATLPPSGAAGGDLAGTYPNPTVDGLQGFPVAPTTPTAGTALVWNTANARWQPGTIASGTAGGDLAGTYPNPTVAGLQGRAVAATAPATGAALVWTGATWAPALLADANVSATAGIARTKLAPPTYLYNPLAADVAMQTAAWQDLCSCTIGVPVGAATDCAIYAKVIFTSTSNAVQFGWAAVYEGASITSANVIDGSGMSARLGATGTAGDRQTLTAAVRVNLAAGTHTLKLAATATAIAVAATRTVSASGVNVLGTSLQVVG